MLDVTESLGNKLGPLPVYAWVGIGVAGVYGFVKFRSRGTNAAASDSATVSDTSSASAEQYGSADGSAGNAGNTSVVSSGTIPSDNPSTPTTNEEWSRIVSDWLISHGRNPADVQNAITSYLAGKPLTTIQQAIVNIAIQAYGVPPTGPIAVVAVPKPAPPAGGGTAPKPRPPVPKTSPGKGKHWVYRAYDNKWHAVPNGQN